MLSAGIFSSSNPPQSSAATPHGHRHVKVRGRQTSCPHTREREAREDSREAWEDSREDPREYSRKEPGGGQGVVNSHKSEGGGSLSESPPQLLRNKLYRPRALLIAIKP